MTQSERAQAVGRRILGEYLKAADVARKVLPPALTLEPGQPITPFMLTPEVLAEWERLDAEADAAKARWRTWLSDPEGYSDPP